MIHDGEWREAGHITFTETASGTLFLDEFHPLRETTQHLLIHGHNMKDGSMFGLLTHYRQPLYWQKHPFISLSTL